MFQHVFYCSPQMLATHPQLKGAVSDPAFQMQVDNALWEWVATQAETVLLARLYEWPQPGVWSTGRFQQDFKPPASSADFPVVQRPTGGRAILHGKDISFALITNHPELLKQSVKESYCTLIQMVRKTLEALEVPLEPSCDVETSAYTRTTLCFESLSTSDIRDANTGKKIVGSAQRRGKTNLLQHGSIFLTAPLPLEIVEPAFCRVVAESASLHQLSPWELPASVVNAVISKAFVTAVPSVH